MQPSAGFKDAMDRLRTVTGRDVTFHIPEPKTWPDGTKLDPESGDPIDPTVQPISGGWTDVVKHASVIFKPESRLRPAGEVQITAAGPLSGTDEILDIDINDWPDVQDATEVTDLGVRYAITEAKATGMTEADRQLVYVEAL